jgi:hypothetical protein
MIGLPPSGVGAVAGGGESIYSKGVAGHFTGGSILGRSSAIEAKDGKEADLSRRLSSSLWTFLWVFGTWRWSALIIAVLKEVQGPCPKEEEGGSETSILCASPLGVRDATVCATGAAGEVAVAKCTAPNFFFCPLPALPRFFFFPWLLPPAGGAA